MKTARLLGDVSATRAIVTLLGILVGIGGAIHGFFEVLQGYRSTDGFFIFAVGKGNSWTIWTEGSEGAFTLVQNYLVTGILAMIVGAVLAVWSVFYIKTKNGSLIFLLIGICLFLVGGGVAQVPFIVLTAAVATRINKPLNWWRNNLPQNLRLTLAKLWSWLFAGFLILFATAFEISIFGFFPQVTEPNALLTICWSLLGLAVILLLTSIVGAFARDIEHNQTLQNGGIPTSPPLHKRRDQPKTHRKRIETQIIKYHKKQQKTTENPAALHKVTENTKKTSLTN